MDSDEFERKLADLESREREIEKREKAARNRGPCRSIYEHVNISIETLDIIIAVVSLSIAALIIIGVVERP
jgi:hypothetical protein